MDKYSELTAKLSLEQKVALVSGKDFWHTVGIPEIGLESMRFSDGPSGVRGEAFDERRPSLSLPSASALSASWDIALAERYGQVAASEAIDKEVDALLGPTINLHRSPLGGRHFEAYSEDPILTGEISAAYVRGVQSKGVSACPKHYIANDSETDRHTVDAIVDEKTLHELYLRPFQITIGKSDPWMIMSSYNSVNGVTMHASPLLEDPLRTKWNYEGVVVSDWTAVRSVESAASEQDLAMPGPFTPWNDSLVGEIRAGRIAEEILDRKVVRTLKLADRVGKLGTTKAKSPVPVATRESLALEVAVEGAVLLENNGILPLPVGANLAISGDSAKRTRYQGGGSAQVLTKPVTSPLEALASRANVSYSMGAEVVNGCVTYTEKQMTNPRTGEPGVAITFRDQDGNVVRSDDRFGTFLIFDSEPGFEPAKLEVEFELDVSGSEKPDYAMGVGTANRFELWVDDEKILERDEYVVYHDLAEAILQPREEGVKFDLNGRSKLHVKAIIHDPGVKEAYNTMSIMVGEVARNDDPEELIAKAVEEAREAEVAVVVVGTNSAVESEGFDRKTITLPGHQDKLVQAVAAVNKNTVVVVNAGSPVDMPWRQDVAAILVTWFGGQFAAEALAAVLFGDAEPAGRLPTSWVMSDEGSPLSTTPIAGKLHYTEGLNIGYRALAVSGKEVDFPIGAGIGYGKWSINSAEMSSDQTRVVATLNNSSEISSKGLAMVFASKSDSKFVRPKEWLVGFARTESVVGETEILVDIDTDYLKVFEGGEWVLEPGDYQLRVTLNFAESGKLLTLSV
jgi:beta-glucosidase